jgi:proton-dependent oligopeptide transporter, POT family
MKRHLQSSSLGDDNEDEDDLPTHVNHVSQLQHLPPECLSHKDPHRPLRHVDEDHVESTYSLTPISYSVALILVVELLERFSFYGIYYTQTLYLTGVYNQEWNPGLTSVHAASFVSTSTAVAYTTPFLGAILADTVLGDYYSILFGAIGLYLPGVLLVALTTIPSLWGKYDHHFPKTALSIAILFLWPMGTGIIKSVVNVFGAKQFHPLLQSQLIERYYVNFYMAINIGALIGITLVPIMAQHNVTHAYMIPVSLLTLGIIIFIVGTPRYVIAKPKGKIHFLCCNNNNKFLLDVETPLPSSSTTTTTISLFTVFRISLLIVPFCIAYSQMPTTFIVQGTVMRKAFHVIDAATMNALDALSVLVFGYLTGTYLYPTLAKRYNIKLATTTKFAIGSGLGAMAMAWALLVEHWIHSSYHHHVNAAHGGTADGSASTAGAALRETLPHAAAISILWQAPAYILIGWGEIFAVSAAYEVAFTASAPQTKALASAVNIFCVGGIPNILCIALYQACEKWAFTSTRRGDTNIQHLPDYATAHVDRYFYVLLGILLFGMMLNLHPTICQFVQGTEQQAAQLIRTPILRKPIKIVGHHPAAANPSTTPSSRRRPIDDDEESPLLWLHPKKPDDAAAALKHQHYLQYGTHPILNKLGSMRAGPSLSHKESKYKAVKKSFIPKLYGGEEPTTETNH